MCSGVTMGFNVHVLNDQWGRVPFPTLTDDLDNFFCEAEFFTLGTSEFCEFFQIIELKASFCKQSG